MTHEEVMAVMEEIGLPYAYHHFAEGESPDPPFAVFLYPGSNNFSADGKVYFKTDRLNIEIYTDIKNIELEQQTEAVLDGHDIFYEKSEVWIEEIGLPYAYHHFAEGESPDPPFAVFLYPGSNNFSADGKVYFKTDRLNIEIYTDIKNIELEQQTEAVLDGHDIFYEKSEVWIESENLYEVLYQMEV